MNFTLGVERRSGLDTLELSVGFIMAFYFVSKYGFLLPSMKEKDIGSPVENGKPSAFVLWMLCK